MKRMAVIDPQGVVEQVVMLDDGASWPVPAERRLVEDVAMIAEPGGVYTDAELGTPRVIAPDPPPGPTVLEQIAELRQRIEALEGA